MKITAQALAALVAAFPHHSPFISERALAGDEEGSIRTALAGKDRAAAEAALTEARAKFEFEFKAHADTKATLAKLEADHAKLKAMAGGAPTDPGAGSPVANGKTVKIEEFTAWGLKAQADFLAAGGKIDG